MWSCVIFVRIQCIFIDFWVSSITITNHLVAAVNAKDADIILRSSDGISFRVYRKDLEAYSEGFVAPPSGNGDFMVETVELSETYDVLQLLLQFMRKQRQPDIKNIEFRLLADLAEAAEKYEVYAAIQLCHIYMRYVLFSSFRRKVEDSL